MAKFVIEEGFWSLFPEARIGVVICHGIDNSMKDPEQYWKRIAQAETEAMKYLTNPNFSANPAIKAWREAFMKFKTKKGARSSIEALLKRVQTGNHLGSINPLVDLYNIISLKYGLPCGGEDIDSFVGDLRLTRAQGGEPFITLGSSQSAPPYPGEVVYKDNAGAVCRCWNWRESVRTMLTEATTNAFLCIELPDSERLGELEASLTELENSVEEHLGGTCRIMILDIDHKAVELA